MRWSVIRARLRKFVAVLKDFRVVEVREDYLRFQMTVMITARETSISDEHHRTVSILTHHERSPIV